MYEVLDLSKDTFLANTFNECWNEEVLYTPTTVITNQYLHYVLWADTPCLKGIQINWDVFVPNSPMIMRTACVCSNIQIHWKQGIVSVWPCDSNVFKSSPAGEVEGSADSWLNSFIYLWSSIKWALLWVNVAENWLWDFRLLQQWQWKSGSSETLSHVHW